MFDDTGVLRGNLVFKDLWIKDQGINPDADPTQTENFEVVICPVPGTGNNEFFIFYTDVRTPQNSPPFALLLFVRYNRLNKQVSSETILTFKFNAGAMRLALSKPSQNGSRSLYVLAKGGQGNLFSVTIPGNGTNPGAGSVVNIATIPVTGVMSSVLELSHDQTRLAWSQGQSIGLYNLSTSTYSSWSPFTGAYLAIIGLEWLPNGGIAISGQSSFGLSGITLVSPAFNSLSVIPNSSGYQISALELGHLQVGNPRLFAFNGQFIQGFDLGTSLPIGPSVPLVYRLDSYNFQNASFPVLPDQIDGGLYTPPGTCGGGPPIESFPGDPALNSRTPATLIHKN